VVPSRFRVVPAAYVIFRRDEQVLLQLRSGTGYKDGHWATAAAGHVEAGESVFDAAIREAREELGITVTRADLEPLCGMHRTAANGRLIDERVDWFFACHRWTGEPRLLESEKAAALDWFELDALPEPVVPHELFVLEHLRTQSLDPVVAFGFPT
jgi:8-oxo-dGTP pyrophosphatase MutT (NUDIX family)